VRGARIFAFALVVAIHTIAIVYFPALRWSMWATQDDTTTIVLLPLPRRQQPVPSQAVHSKSTISKRSSPITDLTAPAGAAPASATSAGSFDPFVIEPSPTPAPTTIDWAREAEKAAADSLSAEETADRQRAALAPHPPAIGDPVSGNASKFAWSEAQTHRVESIPGGGILIHINDRCAIVIPMMLMTICKIGKIGARDDLFQHMNDVPADLKSSSTP
jgi:hypothetical protein